MMQEFDDLLKKAKPLSPEAAKAKAKSIKELLSMLKDGMGEELKGVKKVTVASDSKEGLDAGLDKAKELLGKEDQESEDKKEESEGDEVSPLHKLEESSESKEEEKSESPADEKSEEEKISELEKQLEELKAKKRGNDLASAKQSLKSVF